MRYVSMPVGGLDVSVLGLGCAAMLGRTGRRESLAALGSAWDAGITLYDTARSYGYGESESLLGEFFAGERRQKAVICTKFGILPAAKNWKQQIKPLAQAVVKMFPGLRGMARRQATGQFVIGDFSVDLLRTSFDASLRALRMEYVDMLLLHAAPMPVLAQDDLLEAMERLVEAGKVRMAGISGEHDVIAASFAQHPRGLTTAQFAMNMAHIGFAAQTEKAARDGWFLVANHPFGGPAGVSECRRRIEAMRTDETLPMGLRDKLKEDAQLMPEVVLNSILSGTGVHAVIPAMMQPSHLAGNVRAVENCRFTADELALLRTALS
jgi:aryl-alcohol dehydrogenase-like predicted oxidoreductase